MGLLGTLGGLAREGRGLSSIPDELQAYRQNIQAQRMNDQNLKIKQFEMQKAEEEYKKSKQVIPARLLGKQIGIDENYPDTGNELISFAQSRGFGRMSESGDYVFEVGEIPKMEEEWGNNLELQEKVAKTKGIETKRRITEIIASGKTDDKTKATLEQLENQYLLNVNFVEEVANRRKTDEKNKNIQSAQNYIQTLPAKLQGQANYLASIGEFDKIAELGKEDAKTYAPELKAFTKNGKTTYIDMNKPVDVKNAIDEGWREVEKTGASTKAPSGYRYTENGDLETISGGPADIKMKKEKMKDTASLEGVNLSVDNLTARITELQTMKDADRIFGLMSYTPNITKEARNAQAVLNSIVSQLGVRALNDMRAASSTGGAVGQVTEKEWPILQSQLNSLEQAQDWEHANAAMTDILSTLGRVKANSQVRYGEMWGGDTVKPSGGGNIEVLIDGVIQVFDASGKRIK